MSSILNIKNISSLLRGRVPGQVIIQLTDKCNALCAQCGMRVTNDFPRKTIPLDRVKNILNSMPEKGIQAVSFTGGEPFLHQKELLELINHAGQLKIPYIRTGTNGFMFKGHEQPEFEARVHGLAQKLAATRLRNFWISLDSCIPEIHEKNRGLKQVVRGIEKSLPIFHSYGLYPSANLGINRLTGGEIKDLQAVPQSEFDSEKFYQAFCRAFTDFYTFVADLRFTIVNACYPMSMDNEQDAAYAATSQESMIRFAAHEKAVMYQALFDTIPAFRHQLRIFTPRSSLLGLIRENKGQTPAAYPCRGGLDFFFIDSKDCSTYPCGYRGEENLGKFEDLNISQLTQPAFCRKCEWECFRDPSELCGPILEIFKSPGKLLNRIKNDSEMLKIWIQDLRYYKTCEYFDGRRKPDLAALERCGVGSDFAPKGMLTPTPRNRWTK